MTQKTVEERLIPEVAQNLFEISPTGGLLVAYLDRELLIRVIRTSMVTKNFNADHNSRSISFLPIYFDEDYNHHFIKAQHAKHNKGHAEGEHHHHDELEDRD